MSPVWPIVKLGNVLKQCDRSVATSQLTEVNLAGVYSFGRGLFKRGPMEPGETSYRTYNRLVADDFVISQPKAWEGALARVTDEYAGWYLSPVFPCFQPDTDRLDPRFLEWFCKRETVWTELKQLAQGLGARRESVAPDKFLSLTIPLPSLTEQHRIVGRIEEVAAEIAAAQRLRTEVAEEAEALCRSILASDDQATLTPMRELVRLREPDVAVKPDGVYQFAGVYCFGRGVFRGQQKTGLEFAYPRLSTLHARDFVYPKLMAWEGAMGVVPPECDGCVVSTEFPVFEVLEERVFHEVLDTYFRTPAVWPDMAGSSTGTNVRRRRLNPTDFLNYRFPLPKRETQERLRAVRVEVASLQGVCDGMGGELDAFMPAILDRAFKGEL